MEVRAKKALGQHFLTDQRIAQAIVDALHGPCEALEVGPGMGVLTQYLLQREDIDLKLVEIDGESVDYLLTHFAGMQGRLLQADFLNLRLEKIFPERFSVIGNFPYNISSQIFFKILDYRERIPEVVCMIQKEVAERIAEGPGSKPKVESAVIRLTRNSRTSLGCDESLFKAIVKTAFGQRRKMMRNPLKPLIAAKAAREGWTDEERIAFTANPIFERRPETLSVEDFIALTNFLDTPKA